MTLVDYIYNYSLKCVDLSRIISDFKDSGNSALYYRLSGMYEKMQIA